MASDWPPSTAPSTAPSSALNYEHIVPANQIDTTPALSQLCSPNTGYNVARAGWVFFFPWLTATWRRWQLWGMHTPIIIITRKPASRKRHNLSRLRFACRLWPGLLRQAARGSLLVQRARMYIKLHAQSWSRSSYPILAPLCYSTLLPYSWMQEEPWQAVQS